LGLLLDTNFSTGKGKKWETGTMVTGKIHDERSFALSFVSLKNISKSKCFHLEIDDRKKIARPSIMKDAVAELPASGGENNRDSEAFRQRSASSRRDTRYRQGQTI